MLLVFKLAMERCHHILDTPLKGHLQQGWDNGFSFETNGYINVSLFDKHRYPHYSNGYQHHTHGYPHNKDAYPNQRGTQANICLMFLAALTFIIFIAGLSYLTLFLCMENLQFNATSCFLLSTLLTCLRAQFAFSVFIAGCW